jgi:hypothetical protein
VDLAIGRCIANEMSIEGTHVQGCVPAIAGARLLRVRWGEISAQKGNPKSTLRSLRSQRPSPATEPPEGPNPSQRSDQWPRLGLSVLPKTDAAWAST